MPRRILCSIRQGVIDLSKKEVKTNAMRMLDRMKIPYEYEEYECDEFSDGIETADKLGYDHNMYTRHW